MREIRPDSARGSPNRGDCGHRSLHAPPRFRTSTLLLSFNHFPHPLQAPSLFPGKPSILAQIRCTFSSLLRQPDLADDNCHGPAHGRAGPRRLPHEWWRTGPPLGRSVRPMLAAMCCKCLGLPPAMLWPPHVDLQPVLVVGVSISTPKLYSCFWPASCS